QGTGVREQVSGGRGQGPVVRGPQPEEPTRRASPESQPGIGAVAKGFGFQRACAASMDARPRTSKSTAGGGQFPQRNLKKYCGVAEGKGDGGMRRRLGG